MDYKYVIIPLHLATHPTWFSVVLLETTFSPQKDIVKDSVLPVCDYSFWQPVLQMSGR